MTLKEFIDSAEFVGRVQELLDGQATVLRVQVGLARFRLYRERTPKTAPAWDAITVATRYQGSLHKARCYYRRISGQIYGASDCGESMSAIMRRVQCIHDEAALRARLAIFGRQEGAEMAATAVGKAVLHFWDFEISAQAIDSPVHAVAAVLASVVACQEVT